MEGRSFYGDRLNMGHARRALLCCLPEEGRRTSSHFHIETYGAPPSKWPKRLRAALTRAYLE